MTLLTYTGLAIASHTRTMLTDPGAVPRGNATKENIEAMGLKAGEVMKQIFCSIPSTFRHCAHYTLNLSVLFRVKI